MSTQTEENKNYPSTPVLLLIAIAYLFLTPIVYVSIATIVILGILNLIGVINLYFDNDGFLHTVFIDTYPLVPHIILGLMVLVYLSGVVFNFYLVRDKTNKTKKGEDNHVKSEN